MGLADDETEPYHKPDAWKRDKGRIVAWACSLLGAGAFSWGVWCTVALFGLREMAAVDHSTLVVNEAASRERDKVIAEAAAERAAQIQAQLAQIQAQLAEIQRELRHQVRP